MDKEYVGPLDIIELFVRYKGKPLTETFLTNSSGVDRESLRSFLNQMVQKNLLILNKKGRTRSYRLNRPESEDAFGQWIQTLNETGNIWVKEYLQVKEAEMAPEPAIVESAGAVSFSLDHMVFIEEISTIILSSKKFTDIFEETFKRLIWAVDFDIAMSVTVESQELICHVYHKNNVGNNLIDQAVKSTRELLNLQVPLPFIPSDYIIKGKFREKVEAPAGPIRHRISTSFELDRMTPGIIALYRVEDKPFYAGEKQVLDVLGSQMTLVCRNLNAQNLLKKQALTDDLTGISNKRYFRSIFNNIFQLARRREQPMALGMLDLDHFKRINDLYGHQQGDWVLSEFAGLVREQIRGGDTFARYGGEEFTLLLPSTELSEAVELAEEVRHSVEIFDFPSEVSPIHCTVSIGIASLDPELCRMPDDLIRKADTLLYQAKEQGRNLVIGG